MITGAPPLAVRRWCAAQPIAGGQLHSGTQRLSAVAAKWFLTSAERGNRDTDLDKRAAWSGGNSVRPLVDGQECFRSIAAELAELGTGDEVYFAAWAGDPSQQMTSSGPEIGELMRAALDRGASIRGLFWAPMFGGEPDYVRENKWFAALLAAHGGTVLFDRRVRLLGAHHQKFLVVRRAQRAESDIAFVGGIDPCPSRRDDGGHRGDPQVQSSIAEVYGDRPPWHDAQLAMRGPVVADVETCFRERWRDAREAPFARLLLMGRDPGALPAQAPAPPPRGAHAAQLLRTYPRKTPSYGFARDGERSVARGYAKALATARDFIYLEDQFLWSPLVAECFAEALQRNPELRMLAVLPRRPDKEDRLTVTVNDTAQRRALELLAESGGERVEFLELLNSRDVPIYVHSKLCVVDDRWAAVGSANLNRRSWTYDTELTAAVVDEGDDPAAFARGLRLRLWREHLRRAGDDDGDLLDPLEGIAVLRRAAASLERWCAGLEAGPRPPGHLRLHRWPKPSRMTRAAAPIARALVDPDGRPRRLRKQNRW